MKIVAMSDMHGKLPIVEEEFDIMLICGDIFPTSHGNLNIQKDWLRNQFRRWIKRLRPISGESRIVMVGGNHDYLFYDKGYEWTCEFMASMPYSVPVIYLEDSEADIKIRGKVYRIFATPYCQMHRKSAFMDKDLSVCYDTIPKGLDILISHDAADIGGLGEVQSGRRTGINAGNRYLGNRIRKVKPIYYFCGHIHTGSHILKDVGGTKVCNVSLVNESYKMAYKPLIIDIDGN